MNKAIRYQKQEKIDYPALILITVPNKIKACFLRWIVIELLMPP